MNELCKKASQWFWSSEEGGYFYQCRWEPLNLSAFRQLPESLLRVGIEAPLSELMARHDEVVLRIETDDGASYLTMLSEVTVTMQDGAKYSGFEWLKTAREVNNV